MQKGFRQRANKCPTFHEFLLPIENSLEKVNVKHVWVSNFLSIVDWLGRSSFYPHPGSVCFLALWQRWCIWLFVIFVTNLFGNLLCQGIRHSQLLCSIFFFFIEFLASVRRLFRWAVAIVLCVNFAVLRKWKEGDIVSK